MIRAAVIVRRKDLGRRAAESSTDRRRASSSLSEPLIDRAEVRAAGNGARWGNYGVGGRPHQWLPLGPARGRLRGQGSANFLKVRRFSERKRGG
jgi:hypothetical protein